MKTRRTNMEDKNLEKARNSAEAAVMQDRIKEYQQKLKDLQAKEYSGKYQGIKLTLNGAFCMQKVEINQAFYETCSKSQLETAILVCYSNIKEAIDSEARELSEQLQQEMMRFQSSALNNN